MEPRPSASKLLPQSFDLHVCVRLCFGVKSSMCEGVFRGLILHVLGCVSGFSPPCVRLCFGVESSMC